MIQVHINSNVLVLGEIEEGQMDEGCTKSLADGGKEKVEALIDRMFEEKLEPQVLQGDEQELLQMIQSILTPIEAAGGLVVAPGERVLLIFRRGKWDLPKGKLEKGEDLEACALREVEEETGLTRLTIGSKIMVTYHAYHQWGQKWIKASHWYLMHSEGNETLVPQTDEDIERCEWVRADEIKNYLQNSHGSIREVLIQGFHQAGFKASF